MKAKIATTQSLELFAAKISEAMEDSVTESVAVARKIKDKTTRLAAYLKADFSALTGMQDPDWIESAKLLMRVIK